MGEPSKLTKKQKKAVAFRERRGQSKDGKNAHKRMDEFTDLPTMESPDLPQMEDVELAATMEEIEAETVGSGSRRAKEKGKARPEAKANAGAGDAPSAKKRKRGPDANAMESGLGEDPLQDHQAKKKRRTSGHKQEVDVAEMDMVDGAEPSTSASASKATARKYILFVGNLRYTTSKDAIAQHFSACDPQPEIRLLTAKSTGPGSKPKTKGCAFLEFASKPALQQALRQHLSVLDGRKINVELTVGGGGKGEDRTKKLKARNKELHDQRTKQVEKQNAKIPQGAAPIQVERPQRHSATSGVAHTPVTKRTWTVGDVDDGQTHRGGQKHAKKRGSRHPKNQGTGVNTIPLG